MTARRDFVCNLYTSRERLYDALALKKKKGECVANCGENEIRTRDTL